MREGNKKPKWGKPKLIILFRGKPEELVLSICKAFGNNRTFYSDYWGCMGPPGFACRPCSPAAGS